MTQAIEVVMLLIMVGSLVGAMINRWQLRRGIGGRTIQFVGLSWILGITLIRRPPRNRGTPAPHPHLRGDPHTPGRLCRVSPPPQGVSS